MKQDLETNSGLKIRRGFEKFINKTLQHFGLKEPLSKEESKLVIEFINKSNTKLHEAYWVLRTNKPREEYERELEKYKWLFVNSSYKHSNRKTIAQKFIKIHKSRGYSGWVTINNKDFYCRSQQEFIWLHYLVKVYGSNTLEMEHSIFNIDLCFNYKPDFFVFKNNVLVKLIEVKSDSLYLNSERHKQIKHYFEKQNIEYEVLIDSKNILRNHIEIKEKLDVWKEKAYIEKDMRGEKNPHYGCKASDERKRKIGEHTRTKFKDEVLKTKLINSLRTTVFNNWVKKNNYIEPVIVVKTSSGREYRFIVKDGEILCPNFRNNIEIIKTLLKKEKDENC